MQDRSSSVSTKPNEKALLARIWGDFDTRYMKPLLTHSRPTLLETLPVCCTPLARILTTTQQMTQVKEFQSQLKNDIIVFMNVIFLKQSFVCIDLKGRNHEEGRFRSRLLCRRSRFGSASYQCSAGEFSSA